MLVEDKMNLSFLIIESLEYKAYQIQQDTNQFFLMRCSKVVRLVMGRDFFMALVLSLLISCK